MNRTVLLRIVVVVAASVALAGTPESSFAQRGGHGGGGFHGGGFGGHGGGGSFGGFHNGGGFHSDSGFSNFHGGSFNGFHGGGFHNGGFGRFHGSGFGGFRHDHFFGGFGYPWYGYGWNFGFGFWPYSDFYAYSPWWGAPFPYHYPYGYDPYGRYDYPDRDYDDRDYDDHDHNDRHYDRCRPDYRHPDNGCSDRSPDNSKPNRENPSAKPSSTLAPEDYPDRNNLSRVSHQDAPASNDRTTPVTAATGDFQLAYSAQPVASGMRPAVRNAIEALRAMPPDAQHRQLNSGRYDSFSPEERQLLNSASQPPEAE